ncbi:MAG: symmetrical bis(5'-nucleosyl)-tetraphosphatase [Gammaproteobacteria bacterium]|nr:symmetrical bis(5'-nucleosyl)-tetraphosphatase [Gammaproteobacteria bacterium]
MATYAIGDLQGCLDNLKLLLEKITFNPSRDTLWFVGDLVNRGDQSLETLRFIKQLGKSAIAVLGNHDLTLLALCEHNKKVKHHTLDAILQAPDKEELIHWLRHRPLLHHDHTLGYTMVHAGLAPQWDLTMAQSYAQEVEAVLQSHQYSDFMANMFGDTPKKWNEQLTDWERLRFITNSFTRMRYCSPKGKLNFKDKGPIGTQKKGHLPWYQVNNRKNSELKIIIGHWSTLFGQTNTANVFAIDTGCLWGETLTAMQLDTTEPVYYNIKCKKPYS